MADEAPAPVVLEELEAATEPEVSASEPVDSAAPPPSVDTEELPRPATGAEQHDGINEKGNDAPPNGTVGEEVRLGSRKSPDATNREDREDREDGEEGEHRAKARLTAILTAWPTCQSPAVTRLLSR